MKALKWIIPAGIIGYFFYKYSAINSALKGLTYTLGSVRFNKNNSTLSQIELQVTLNVTNPTSQTLYFNRFAGSLFIDNQTLANVDISGAGNSIAINPNRTTEVVFPVRVNPSQAINTVASVIGQWLTGNYSQMVKLTGRLWVGNFELPINSETPIKQMGQINGVKKDTGMYSLYLNY